MHFSRQAQDMIADLRSIPRSSTRVIDRGTKPIDTLIEVCLERHKIGRETTEETIMRNWTRIIGPTFAHRCSPIRIDARRRLIIAIPNASLRRELQFHEDRIMTALRAIEGCDHLQGVLFRAG